MTSKFPAAVIFDLDGTLVDTAPDLAAALNRVLGREGRAPVASSHVRHMVGHGARHLLVEGMKATGTPATEADLKRLVPVFLSFYNDHIADESVPFPGMVEALSVLRNDGVRLGVCTNKAERLSRRLLRSLNLDGLFDVVVGGDTLAVRKPHPGHILETLTRLDVGPTDAVMVGDSINDVAAARAARVPVVAVSFGYSDRPVIDLGADLIIEHFSALHPALRTLMTP